MRFMPAGKGGNEGGVARIPCHPPPFTGTWAPSNALEALVLRSQSGHSPAGATALILDRSPRTTLDRYNNRAHPVEIYYVSD